MSLPSCEGIFFGDSLPAASWPVNRAAIAVVVLLIALLIPHSATPSATESSSSHAHEELSVVIAIGRLGCLLEVEPAAPAAAMPSAPSTDEELSTGGRRRASCVWRRTGVGGRGCRVRRTCGRRRASCRCSRGSCDIIAGRRRWRSCGLPAAGCLQSRDGAGIEHACGRQLLHLLEFADGVPRGGAHDSVLRHRCSQGLRQAGLSPCYPLRREGWSRRGWRRITGGAGRCIGDARLGVAIRLRQVAISLS